VTLDVHVVTPEREVWTGEAHTVIARGIDGVVGILTGHAPMMVQLAIGPLRIQRDGEPELAAVVDGGFMHVTSAAAEDEADDRANRARSTRVDVLAAHAELASDIDVEAARERAAELEQQLAQNHDTHLAEADVASIRAELRKAVARISLAG
jgi:F-type H+-transporting ATPase subunit epsilon